MLSGARITLLLLRALMNQSNVEKSGVFRIGGTLPVHRLGFGAMRITGTGIWNRPADEPEARRTLKRVVELGIDFIDTADSYGPHVSEELIGEELHPYGKSLVIATKGGLMRPGPNQWVPNGRPEYLRACLEGSLTRLKKQRIQLWQLHRIDPKVPRDEQLEAIAEFQKEGLVEHLGLSEVRVDDIKAAQKVFKVATVQNLYNLVNRQSESVLDYCEQQNIGFIPWNPLAAGNLARPHSLLEGLAAKHKVSPSGIALAWVLKRSKVMLPIPGTGKVAHLEENDTAGGVELSDEEFKSLDEAARADAKKKK